MRTVVKKRRRILIAIAALMLLHVVVLAVLPIGDPSEARYASLARQMAVSNDYITPRVWIDGHLIPFMGKPPFGYWMMSAAIEVFGPTEFAVRIPTFVAGLLLLGIMFHVLRRSRCGYQAVSATLICGTAVGFYLLSGAAMIDMWLYLFSIGAVFWHHAFVREESDRRKQRYSLLVFVFLGLAFVTKGPVGLVFFGVPVFAWTLVNHRWDALRYHSWGLGLSLFTLISVPWFVLAESATPGFLHYFFVNENLLRFVSPDKRFDLYSKVSHSYPPGTAFVFALLVCLPWALIPAMRSLRRSRRARRTPMATMISSRWRRLLQFKWFERKTGEAEIDLFAIAPVSIVLFWCFSAHVMVYYMVAVVPLFAVWSARALRLSGFPLRRIARMSVAMLALYVLAAVPAYFMLSATYSTKQITAEALRLLGARGSGGNVVFARRVPYSAYFYGEGMVAPHAKETTETSLQRSLEVRQRGDVIALRADDYSAVSDGVKKRFRVEYDDCRWILITKQK